MIFYEWDSDKRESNLEKHGFDFFHASLVHEHRDKVTFESNQNDEIRLMDIAPIDGRLCVLIYTLRGQHVRIISFRKAYDPKEIEMYEQHITWRQGND